ncbi:MAG TPA: protein phosphatase 2C domain-containing protein [Gammaproteobacteria bacterium]|nr:protein phosphatase 2C domain-containing protein [Gammaproteobacteria bacterium]
MLKKATNPWTSAGLSHPGRVRKTNEDAFLVQPQAGLWAVADGMGGHAAGDVASRTVVDALAQVGASGSLTTLDALVTATEDALLEANTELLKLAMAQRQSLIGTTIAVLVSMGNHVVCLWAGDSRIYRYRPTDKAKRALQPLTQDHAVVEELMQVGLLNEAEVDLHPHANRITRAIGAADTLFVDMEIYALQKGDQFLICSDGLYKELSSDDIASIMAAQDNDESCAQALLDKTLERGARDNTSVVIMSYGEKPA